MKRIFLIAAVMMFSALGCTQPTLKESKTGAYDKWAKSRAKVLCSLASDHLYGGSMDNACRNAEEGLSLDPENKELQLLLAKIYIEKGFYGRAIGLLQGLRQREQQEATAQRSPIIAEVTYLLGAAQEKEGLLDEALASYTQAAEIDRSNAAPILAATEVIVAQGDLQKAQDFLTCHMGRYRPEAAIYELAGRLAMMRKQYAEAAKHFQMACDMDSKNMRYPEMLATAQYAGGDYHRAGETLNRLLRRSDYKGPPWVYKLQGDCLMAAQRFDPAQKAYQKAVDLRPEDPDSWARLAKAALAQNQLTKAIRSAYQARKLDTNHLEGGMILGFALLKIDKPEDAITVLSDIAKAHPDDDVVLCLLGRAYSKIGREDTAHKFYDAAARIRPGSVLSKELLASAK